MERVVQEFCKGIHATRLEHPEAQAFLFFFELPRLLLTRAWEACDEEALRDYLDDLSRDEERARRSMVGVIIVWGEKARAYIYGDDRLVPAVARAAKPLLMDQLGVLEVDIRRVYASGS